MVEEKEKAGKAEGKPEEKKEAAEEKKEKPKEKKAKGKKGKKLKAKLYSLKENKVERGKFCPKCGAGVFMAAHESRYNCGKCTYTEWKQK